MSSDDYWGEDLDSVILNEVDAIERTQVAPVPHRETGPSAEPPSDDYDESFIFDEAAIARAEKYATAQFKSPVAGTSEPTPFRACTNMITRQSTLDGHVLQNSSKAARLASPQKRLRKTMMWDQTRFAQSGSKRSEKRKGKSRAEENDDDCGGDIEDDDDLFDHFPKPEVEKRPIGPPPPMKLRPDLDAAKHWIYPTNQSRRDYQFNIVSHSLFENTLVALPTGLGKTFIAGVLMLNYYRWFPEGKVVFVAPTKPLVAQQIEACHESCGIPGRDAVELTGLNARSKRADAWHYKRVFYMTPQTLYNDLSTNNCDPQDIVLLVVDEAHKARGEYAYAKVVRLLMAKNPHFRVLALTATPGSDRDTVQEIVNCLHISHIEIRDENSIDLRPYLHKKNIQQHIVDLTEEVTLFRDQLGALMRPMLQKCHSTGVLSWVHDPIQLHPFATQRAQAELKPHQKSAIWPLLHLGALSRALSYLLENSTQMCYESLIELSQHSGSKGKASWQTGLAKNPQFKTLLQEMERRHNAGFSIHPKMEKLKALALDHFANAEPDTNPSADVSKTRMIVFSTFRSCVDEIVQLLNQQQPLLRAASFIGQSSDKSGNKGLAQKDQIALIKRFKEGEFNILVSTSIGEEGLDIGEVDMIICCDAQKTPIRMLQRVGRTGRKRDGRVGVLLAPGREEKNWTKATETYKEVQHTIVRGSDLELYNDVERLLPVGLKPKCKEEHMVIEKYVRDSGKNFAEEENAQPSTSKALGKRKRARNGTRNEIPEDASKGFVSVAQLLAKAKRRKLGKTYSLGDNNDSTDEELAAGIFGPSRTVSKGKQKGKKSLRSVSIAGDGRTESLANRHHLTQGSEPTGHHQPLDSKVIYLTDSESETPDRVGLASNESQRPNVASPLSRRPTVDVKLGEAKGDSSWLLLSEEGSDREDNESEGMDPGDIQLVRGMTRNQGIHQPWGPARRLDGISTHLAAKQQSAPSDTIVPELSQAVRPAGQVRRRTKAVRESSPDLVDFAQTTRRIQRCKSDASQDAMPPPPRPERRQRISLARHNNHMLAMEAEHSGDETSEGHSDINDHPESESDRRFLEELPETQASPSYNQTQVYRQSLFTQRPGHAPNAAPAFARPRIRTGPFAGGRPNPGVLRTSSPRSVHASDDYEFGSFVVHDDDDITMLSD